MERWKHQIDIRYRQGKYHVNADTLPRLQTKEEGVLALVIMRR